MRSTRTLICVLTLACSAAIAFIIVICQLFLVQDLASDTTTGPMWTELDSQRYAKRHSRQDSFQRTLLREDFETYQSQVGYAQPAISGYPSPVIDYGKASGAILPISFELDGLEWRGTVVAVTKDLYRTGNDNEDQLFLSFVMVYATDLAERGPVSLVSRNFPHYLSTGSHKTSLGEIDWVHLDHANSQDSAIIAQRYFDLTQGRLVVVLPLKDGTLRFHQTTLKDDDISSEEVTAHITGTQMPSLTERVREEIESEAFARFLNGLSVLQ